MSVIRIIAIVIASGSIAILAHRPSQVDIAEASEEALDLARGLDSRFFGITSNCAYFNTEPGEVVSCSANNAVCVRCEFGAFPGGVSDLSGQGGVQPSGNYYDCNALWKYKGVCQNGVCTNQQLAGFCLGESEIYTNQVTTGD